MLHHATFLWEKLDIEKVTASYDEKIDALMPMEKRKATVFKAVFSILAGKMNHF